MSEVSDWNVVFVVDAPALILSNDPWCVGMYEFSKKREPFSACEEALIKSAATQAVILTDGSMRIRTYINDVTAVDAARLGRVYATEALVLFRKTAGMPLSISLTPAGALFDLRTGTASPISRRAEERSPFGTTAIMDYVARHPAAIVNLLLSVSPKTFGELGSAVRRSAHWSHLAGESDDYGQRFLLQYMAAETLTRVGIDDTLSPKLAAAAGMPSRGYQMQLPREQVSALLAVAEFQPWRTRVNALLDDMREARNSIAHSGFREIDLETIFSPADLIVVRNLLPLVVGELQRMALNGLVLGMRTVQTMWQRYSEAFLLHRSSVADHFTGHVLPRLSQPKQ